MNSWSEPSIEPDYHVQHDRLSNSSQHFDSSQSAKTYKVEAVLGSPTIAVDRKRACPISSLFSQNLEKKQNVKVSSAQDPSIADDSQIQAKSAKFEESTAKRLKTKDNSSKNMFNDKIFAVDAGQKSSLISISKKRARPSSSVKTQIFRKKHKVNVFSAQADVTVEGSQSYSKSSKDGLEAGLESPTSNKKYLQRKVNNIPDDCNQEMWNDATNIQNDIESDFVQTFRPSQGTKIYAFKAGMGMGKTSMLREYVNKNPCASFLVVSSKISLSNSQQGVLQGFDHYSKRNWDSRRLIVQYESLHNISQFYDYIILDQIRSVLCCMQWSTNLKIRPPNVRFGQNPRSKIRIRNRIRIRSNWKIRSGFGIRIRSNLK